MCDISSAAQTTYPQVKIVSIRMMKPETTERLLNMIVEIPGIRRILLRGQNIPKMVPYGPARGIENITQFKTGVSIGGTPVDIRLMVGDILIELENAAVVEAIQEKCEKFFTNFGFYIQKGIFIKPLPSMVDYAKYGPVIEPSLVGLADPRKKEMPVLIGRHSEVAKVSPSCENSFLEG